MSIKTAKEQQAEFKRKIKSGEYVWREPKERLHNKSVSGQTPGSIKRNILFAVDGAEYHATKGWRVSRET